MSIWTGKVSAVVPSPQKTLWFRPGRRHKWQPVYTGTSQECTAAIGSNGRHGDWLTLPSDHPNPDCVTRRPA